MRSTLFILALILAAVFDVLGQTGAERIKGFKDSRFEVVSANSLFVTSVEDCNNVILVAAYVRRGSLTKTSLSGFAQRIRSRLLKDQTVAIFFFTDLPSAKRFFETNDPQEDAEVLRAVRGVYTFQGSPLEEKSRTFPSGLTESDLEKVGNNQ